MKICVATHCVWTSIGSMLQAFGLKSALEELGCESFIATDVPQRREKRKRIASPKSAVSAAYDALHKKSRQEAFKRGVEFIDTMLDVDEFDNYEALCNAQIKADAYIAGSDQIWQPSVLKPLFFLDFADKSAKRISYAASMGKQLVDPQRQPEFEKLLANIETISVREEECRPVVEQASGKQAQVNIDPTFLCSKQKWQSVARPYPIEGKYILSYTIYWDAALNEKMAQLHRKTGLPIVAVSSHLTRAYANKRLFDVGPREFLWLVEHAEYVVTSSFHGAAFSAIFNKKFAAVINPDSPSRISNLMRLLKLPVIEIDKLDTHEGADWTAVNDAIAEEKRRSMKYLKEALEI